MASDFFQKLSAQQQAEGFDSTPEPDVDEPRVVPHTTTSDRGADSPVSLDEKATMLYSTILSFLAGQVDYAQWEGPPPENYDELYRILLQNGAVLDDNAIEADVEDPRMEDLDFRIAQIEEHLPRDYVSLVQLMLDVFLDDADGRIAPEETDEMESLIMEEILPDTERAFMRDLLIVMKARKHMYEQTMSELGPLAAILGLGPKN